MNEKSRLKAVPFIDGIPQIPEGAEFAGILPLFKEVSSDKTDTCSKAMNIDRNVEPCTCCEDVVKLLEAVSEIPGNSRNFTLYKTEVYLSKEPSWCYFLLVAGDEFPIVITEELANRILQNPDVGRDIAFNHWMDRWK